jgi:membrane protease YdiL (CAAX protease family)
LAWVVIVGMVAAILLLRKIQAEKAANESIPVGERLSLAVMQLQGRVSIGMAELQNNRQSALEQIKTLNTGSLDQRLRFAVLAGELGGPSVARIHITELEQATREMSEPENPVHAKTVDVLRRLYADYGDGRLDAPSVSSEERVFLVEELGWFGELALAPADGNDATLRQEVLSAAWRTLIGLLVVVVVAAVLLSGGLIGGFIWLFLLLSGKLRGGLGATPVSTGIYAETFAIWIVLFIGLLNVVERAPIVHGQLLLLGLASLTSLVALGWPVVRGIPWRQVRQDIGLHGGRRPVLEPLIGVGCYAMALPWVAVAVMLVLGLMALQRYFQGLGGGEHFNTNQPLTHPIVEAILAPDWWLRLQVLFVACVTAPVVEEIAFRGLLYRQLRGATARVGTVASVMLAATAVSFVFAVIHPQGLMAVPILMALAFGFTLAREWRGSLVPGMVAHAMTNGMTMALVITLFGS